MSPPYYGELSRAVILDCNLAGCCHLNMGKGDMVLCQYVSQNLYHVKGKYLF